MRAVGPVHVVSMRQSSKRTWASSRESKRWPLRYSSGTTVERFDPAVLPGAARIDEDGIGPVEAAPVGHGVGDELGPAVEGDVGGGAAFSDQALVR